MAAIADYEAGIDGRGDYGGQCGVWSRGREGWGQGLEIGNVGPVVERGPVFEGDVRCGFVACCDEDALGFVYDLDEVGACGLE